MLQFLRFVFVIVTSPMLVSDRRCSVRLDQAQPRMRIIAVSWPGIEMMIEHSLSKM